MDETLGRVFLEYSAAKLEQLAGRIETCLGQLPQESVWYRGNQNANAVGNLVLHLCGNVRQWIGTGVAGLPEVRDRDAEFAAQDGGSAADLSARLRSRTAEAAAVLRSLDPVRLGDRIVVQSYHVTVLEAIYHVVEHYSGHTGQIIFATKALTGSDLGFYAHLRNSAHEEPTP